jgi:hypothetical protein
MKARWIDAGHTPARPSILRGGRAPAWFGLDSGVAPALAQDVHAAFGLGADGQATSTVNANGIVLAAIQGLSAGLQALRDGLHERLAAIEARLDLHAGGDR